MSSNIFNNLVILIILTNIFAEQIHNEAFSVDKSSLDADPNATTATGKIPVSVDQGLFIISIPFNPCSRNEIQDRRGKCRKIIPIIR